MYIPQGSVSAGLGSNLNTLYSEGMDYNGQDLDIKTPSPIQLVLPDVSPGVERFPEYKSTRSLASAFVFDL
jgi:hypothetical protein